jgi:hypothetical protein
VLPIGGFTGTIPAPALAQLQAGIRAQRFRLVLATTRSDPRMRWIAAHCPPAGPPGPVRTYLCLPGTAGPGGGQRANCGRRYPNRRRVRHHGVIARVRTVAAALRRRGSRPQRSSHHAR